MTCIKCRGFLNGARGFFYARWLHKRPRHKLRVCRVAAKNFPQPAEMRILLERLPAGELSPAPGQIGNPMADDEITLESLVTFQLGDMEGGIALVLGYATSPEKLSKGEMDAFAIGMTREKAAELGRALVEITDKAPATREPRGREH
jgi:hypothetical protein